MNIFFKYWILAPIVLTLVFISSSSLAQDSTAQSEEVMELPPPPPPPLFAEEEAYEGNGKIQEDGRELELLDMDDLRSFAVLEKAAEQNRFIFTGEDHRVETLNTVLETKMMRYLNSRGYNYYFIEAGKATESLVNAFIVKGDTAAERMLRNYFNPNFFRMFSWLKESNEDRPKEKRVHAVGLDIERNVPLALRLLKSMLPEAQTPDSLEMFVESLQILTAIHEAKAGAADKDAPETDEMFDFSQYRYQYNFDDEDDPGKNRYFYFSAYKSVLEMTKEFRRKEQEFKTYLGEGFTAFERMIKELENWEVWINYEKQEMPQSWVYRELYMESNFRKFLKEHPGAKGFGQFGRCHVTRITKVGDCGFAFFSSFNKRLITKIPEIKDSVLSIGVFYAGLERTYEFFDNGNIVDIMNETEEGTATLYMGVDEYADDELRDKFSYVIVAKGENAGTIKKRKGNSKNDDFYTYDDRTGIYFNAYQHLYNLSSLNDKTGASFQTISPWFEFGYHTIIERMFLGFDYAFLPVQNRNSGDTLRQSFKGYHTSYQVGGDLIKNRHFEFIPSIGLGFQQMTYSEEHVLRNGLLSDETRTDYRNPAFVIDLRTQVGWQGEWLSLYVNAGYRLDVSKPEWKLGDDRIKDGPDSRWSGLMLGLGCRLAVPM